jgi:phenylpropionate dioxygenase-like ring-hydroxylating dioxygenase large terminal subunit
MSSTFLTSSQLADAQLLLDRLITEHKPGHALQREFQTDPGIYQLDLERIWRRGWLFAGHTCQVKHPGDYFVFDVDTDSIIVIRGDDERIHALHNTCRHRGMKVCQAASGHLARIVCPYHQWSYARNGELAACGGMDKDGDLDRRDFGLHRVHVREVGGLIFVCLTDAPPAFEGAEKALGTLLAPQGLALAKVAATRSYEVRANWKLVWENNRECWHCNVNHPQYIKANYDNAPIDDPVLRHEIEMQARATSDRLAADGLRIDYQEAGMVRFPSPDCWWSINRTPLAPGWVSESIDAELLEPLERRSLRVDSALTGRSAEDARAGAMARGRGCRRGQGLRARRAPPVLGAHQRAGLGSLREEPGRRELVGLHAGPLLHQARVQRDPLHRVVSARNRQAVVPTDPRPHPDVCRSGSPPI